MRQACLLTVPRFSVKTGSCSAALGQYPLTLNYSHLTAIYITLRNFNHKYKLIPRFTCFHVVSHTNVSLHQKFKRKGLPNLIFTNNAWGSNKIYNHNRQAQPCHLTTLGQFYTPFVLTINTPYPLKCYPSHIILGLQSGRFRRGFPPKFCMQYSASHPVHMPIPQQWVTRLKSWIRYNNITYTVLLAFGSDIQFKPQSTRAQQGE